MKRAPKENRDFNDLSDFFKNLHKGGTSIINFNNSRVPCININNDTYNELINKVAGKKLAVDTLLNIFHDGVHVFVDIRMKFLNIGSEYCYLVYANDMLEFFQALSTSGLIAIAPESGSESLDPTRSERSGLSSGNLLAVQIPKKEAAENALRIITTNSKQTTEAFQGKDEFGT
jgi:hypothetical protein